MDARRARARRSTLAERARAVRAGDGGVAAGAELGARRARRRIVLRRRDRARAGSAARAPSPRCVREALAAMADGQPRLLFLGSARRARRPRRATGIVTVADGVRERGRDGGLPGAVRSRAAASWWSAGRRRCTRSRVQARCARVGRRGGRRRRRPDEHPHPELVRTTLDLDGLGIGPSTAIVVATQGHYDDLALEAALATDAGYIGVVAVGEAGVVDCSSCCATEGVDDDAAGAGHAPGRARPRVGRQRRDRGRRARRSRRAAGRRRSCAPCRRTPTPRRGRRPRVRHDRVRRPGEVPHRARRRRLLVLRRRLPARLRGRPRRLPHLTPAAVALGESGRAEENRVTRGSASFVLP